MRSLFYILGEVVVVMAAVVVIQEEVAVVVKIQVNEDSISVNTVAKPTIFLSNAGKVW